MVRRSHKSHVYSAFRKKVNALTVFRFRRSFALKKFVMLENFSYGEQGHGVYVSLLSQPILTILPCVLTQ